MPPFPSEGKLMPGRPLPRHLTQIQRNILRFIVYFTKTNGWAPTVDQIRLRFGYKSTSTVQGHLNYIERKGFIVRGHSPRTIRVVERGAKISRTGAPSPTQN